MEREHGRIVSVSTRTLGSPLDADTAAGATSLVVFDAGDFDESGGTLNINGATLAYASVDDDTATITLTDALPADALDGDFVACWDTLYDRAGTEQTAMVQLDGDDDNPDTIEAGTEFLPRRLEDGDRGGPGESCTLQYDEEEDDWQILGVRGLDDAAGEKHCNTDTFTVTAVGDQTIPLSHTPSDGSLEVVWHPDGLGGVTLTSAEWTLDGSTLTVPNAAGPFAAGDLIDPLYAYRDGPITPTITSAPSLAGSASFDSNATYSAVPLPAGTKVGDLILFAGSGPETGTGDTPPTVNDSRLTYVPNSNGLGLYVGTADTLDDLQISGGGSGSLRACYEIATFHDASVIATQVIEGASSLTIPSIKPAKGVALIGLSIGSGAPVGVVSFGSEYTSIGGSGADYDSAHAAYWVDMAADASPASTATSTIGSPTTSVLIVRMA